MRRIVPIAALVLVVSGFGGATTARNGRIAFTRYRLQDEPLWSEIWVANPDGSGAHRVSHSPVAVEDDQAHWSPDGRWITFDRCTATGPCSVWLVHPDGSGQRRLPIGCCDNSNPAFAPDGKHIVVQHEWGRVRHGSIPGNDQIEHSSIATVDLNGGHLTILRRLDAFRGGLEAPRISPDGTHLLYRSYRWRPSEQPQVALYVADPDGGAAHRVTPWRLRAGGADWSPDSKTILFRSTLVGGELVPGSALFVVRSNGSGLHGVTRVGGYHYVITGTYSPDGSSIVFATDDGAKGTFADVFTLDLASGRRVQVTRSANLDGWPSWGARPG